MAGKGSGKIRKRSKKPVKPASSVERFANEAISKIIQICGFPTEKIPVKESETSEFGHSKFLMTTSLIALTMALIYRDNWRRMFESRFRSSGLDDIKKIEEHLAGLLSVNAEFKKGSHVTKTHILLALYSELILFLNFKGAEVDLEQLYNSWSCYFIKHFAQNQCTDKLLQQLNINLIGTHDYLRDVTKFIEEYATPYGRTEEISKRFKEFSAAQLRIECERKRRLEEANKKLIERVGFVPPNLRGETDFSGAGMTQSSFSRVLEMGADLPGDRKSPEPERGPLLKEIAYKQKSRKLSAKETAMSERLPGKSSRKPSAKETAVPQSLPGKSSRKPSAKETDVSESFLGDQDSSSSEMKIESRFESMKLDDETDSQKTQGAIPKRRPPRKLSAKSKYASKRRPEGSEVSSTSTEHKIIDRLESASSGYEGSYMSSDILLGLGTVLPGDRDSSDPGEYLDCDVDKSREPYGRKSARATGTLEGQSVKPKRKPSSKKKRN